MWASVSPTFGDPAKYLPLFATVIGVLLAVIVVASFGIRRSVKGDVDQPGMFGIVGRMGSGKTYLQALMAYRALHTEVSLKCSRCLELGEDAPAGCGGEAFGKTPLCSSPVRGNRAVYANFWVDGAQPIAGWADVVGLPFGAKKDGTTGALVLIDEAQLWWPSTAWNAPPYVKAWCSQVRKRRQTVVWSSQHQTHVAKRLMQLTFGVWRARIVSGMHVYTLFEPSEFGKESAKHQARVKYKRQAAVMASYDTEEIIQPACDWDAPAGSSKDAPASV